MRTKRIFSILPLLFVIGCECSFINSVYPRIKAFDDGGDPGEPLFLTTYIENGDIDKARQLAKVNHKDIDIPNYSGYFTVNKTYNSNIFFWYFPAASNAEEAPVLLWLQGGPGATSMFGLFAENGPFTITRDLGLLPRKYSWHLNHHLIYIDNPVGTGFSFTKSDAGYATNEEDVGRDLLLALQQFFQLFPQLQQHPFYISGESYGGKYVPAIGYAIHQDSQRTNSESTKPKINLKGLAIGNGYTDPIHQVDYADYLYQIGLIDANGRDIFATVQQKGIDLMAKGDFDGAFDVFEGVTGDNGLFQNWTGFDMYYNFLQAEMPDTSVLGTFLQKSDTRRAIHVGNVSFVDENVIVELKLKSDVMRSVVDWVSELLAHYPIVVYNGQLDIICAYPMTENYLRNLKFNGAEQYKTAKRMIWRVDKEIAGYVKHAGNLTEVLVRNAGHMVPADQPKWALDLILRITHQKGFSDLH